jgi:hypothetical protein
MRRLWAKFHVDITIGESGNAVERLNITSERLVAGKEKNVQAENGFDDPVLRMSASFRISTSFPILFT